MPKISALPATTLLTGTELVPLVQDGVTKQIVYNDLTSNLTATVAPSVTAAEAAAAAAALSASSAGTASTVSAAVASLITSSTLTSGAYTNNLIGGETTAIAFASEDTNSYTMRVVDATTPANNRTGEVTDFITGVYTNPKLVTKSDGHSLEWSRHNLAKQTDNPGANITGATVVTGVTDSDGGTQAATITATSAVTAAFAQIAVGSSVYLGLWHTLSWIVKAGTGTFFYLAYNDGAFHHAWFNASTWATGTVDAGITASSYATRADGTALPSGYRRLVIQFQTTTNSINIYCGVADADASKAVTIGRTCSAEKPYLHLGKNLLTYYENTNSASAKYGAPYDYYRGYKALLVEPSATYVSRYGDDLTNVAWTKTNMTAAFTATGPHNETCSTLTATAINATCLQAIVSAPTSQIFTAYVKRRTGTGPISITSDNGATWKVITSSINSSYYVPVYVNGTTNPTIGFKIDTNADAIDVALAINCTSGQRSTSFPVYGANVSRNADVFTIPTTLCTAGTAYTIYVDYVRGAGVSFNDTANVRFGTSGFTNEARFDLVAATGVLSIRIDDGAVNKAFNLWHHTEGERMEFTMKLEANKHVFSVNGDPSGYISTVGMTATNQLAIGRTGPIYLRRVLIVPRAIDKDDVRTWRYANGVINGLLDTKVVAWDSDPLIPNTTMNREPLLAVISDDGETADVLVTWNQKHSTGFHSEAPARNVSRTYRFVKSTRTILPLSSGGVVYQPPLWSAGFQHSQSPAAVILQTGPYAGRAVMCFSALENNTFTPDKRSIYYTYNDTGGANNTAWSTPVKIIDTPNGQYNITSADGSMFVLPPDHPVAPNRIICPLYGSFGARTLYSDDWGATWLTGNYYVAGGGAVATDEINMTWWPDASGTLILTARITGGAPTTNRYWAKSSDGGLNWVDQGALPAYSYTPCSAGITQLDPTGLLGDQGKVALSHPESAANRFGAQIDFATDTAMTFGNSYHPWPGTVNATRYFGYSSIKPLFGGTHLAYAVEGGSTPFNVDNSIHIAFIQLP